MSEDKDKKTEEPTHRSLQDARKKGQVARSKEVVSALVLLTATIYFYLFWGNIIEHLKDIIAAPSYFYQTDFNTAAQQTASYTLSLALKVIILPFIALLFLVTIFANIAQFGFLFAVDPVIPKPERIDPISGFERVFSMKTIGETVLSLLKIILISAVIWHIVFLALSTFPNHPEQCDLSCYQSVFQSLALKMIALLIPLFIVLAILDYMLQKYAFLKQQRMTKEEAKRQHKNIEGDPFIKSSRKSLHMEMLYDDLEERIKFSRIIITDYNKAIALSYTEEMALPVILCKSTGGTVAKILTIAREENVPIIENTTLTHLLFEDGDIDDYIPQSSVKAVAELLL
jgi:type III secretion protein U